MINTKITVNGKITKGTYQIIRQYNHIPVCYLDLFTSIVDADSQAIIALDRREIFNGQLVNITKIKTGYYSCRAFEGYKLVSLFIESSYSEESIQTVMKDLITQAGYTADITLDSDFEINWITKNNLYHSLLNLFEIYYKRTKKNIYYTINGNFIKLSDKIVINNVNNVKILSRFDRGYSITSAKIPGLLDSIEEKLVKGLIVTSSTTEVLC